VSDLKLLVFDKPEETTPEGIIQALEVALARAKAGQVTYAVMAYGVRSSEKPVMTYCGTLNSVRNAKDAVFALRALEKGLLDLHVGHNPER
jgi:hypothetical protein